MTLHFAFLGAALVENKDNFYPTIALAGITVLLALFYYDKLEKKTVQFLKVDAILVLLTITGALVIYWLHTNFIISTVLAAGIVGFGSSFIPFFNRSSIVLRELPAALYCGAFAGMTATFVSHGYFFILLTGMFAGLLLIISKKTLQGFGGKLGTLAFGGVIITFFIHQFLF